MRAIWKALLVPAAFAAVLAAGADRAAAQYRDRTTLQAVTLFRMTCMRFAGDVPELRAWAELHKLPRLDGLGAAMFSPVKPAQAYWASTPDGKLIVSSADSGACAILAEHGNGLAMETALVTALQRDKVTVTPVLAQHAEGKAQQILRAQYANKAWTLSITTKKYPAAPDQLPMIILLATRSTP